NTLISSCASRFHLWCLIPKHKRRTVRALIETFSMLVTPPLQAPATILMKQGPEYTPYSENDLAATLENGKSTSLRLYFSASTALSSLTLAGRTMPFMMPLMLD
ncbi:hypothetical protein BDN70DRAFT_978444, partial [Pholiota conissans]